MIRFATCFSSFLIAAVAFLIAVPAFAQYESLADLKKAGRGAFLFDVLSENPGCPATTATIATRKDGKWIRATVLHGTKRTVWGVARAQVRHLPAGEYVVAVVSCDKRHYNGPHARFEIHLGEMVNLGQLSFKHEQDSWGSSTGTLRVKITPIADDVVAEAKSLLPDVMKQVAKRPMKIMGSEERRIKSNLF